VTEGIGPKTSGNLGIACTNPVIEKVLNPTDEIRKMRGENIVLYPLL
jgi:hypothetical protein